MRKNVIVSTVLVLFTFFASTPEAVSQITIPKRTVTTPQPNTSKQTVITQASPGQAEYNVGALVKKLALLEAQITVLQKQNAVLASEISVLQKQSGTLTAQSKNFADQLKGIWAEQKAELTLTNSKLLKLELRLDQLDSSHHALKSSFVSHKHHMPAFGQQALSSIPGMQDIANKAGVGYVKSQWENIRILFLGQYSGGIDVTGSVYNLNQ